jgi:hypothetical protein
MKYLAILFTFCLLGCFPTAKFLDKPKEMVPTYREYQYDYNAVWNSVLRTIVEYPITLIEKESGIINTDWLGRTIKKKVSVWRGLIGGGQVEDEIPIELQERFNILVTKDTITTTVKIIRYVKVRPYKMTMGGPGNWEPDAISSFVQVQSDTQTEHSLLEEIENCLKSNQIDSLPKRN